MFICFVSSDIPSYFHLKNVKNSREWSSGDEFANHDVVGGQKTHTFHMLILPLIPVAILLIQGQTGHFFPHIVSLPLAFRNTLSFLCIWKEPRSYNQDYSSNIRDAIL